LDTISITFVNSNEEFKNQFLIEKEYLKSLLGDYIIRISHIGSTAIKNIRTKPIVDILIESNQKDFQFIKVILLKDNYILMSGNVNKMSFNKGYTINGYDKNVFHIHVKKYDDCDELYFRDYLIDNPDVVKQYENLKYELYNKYNPNRDLYTEGKSKFIKEIVKLSKKEYKDRY